MNANHFTLPAKPAHLLDIREVRKLYAKRTGRPAVRQTVNEWLNRRGIHSTGPNVKQRLFDRAAVTGALAVDFSDTPKFITIAEALRMAHRA